MTRSIPIASRDAVAKQHIADVYPHLKPLLAQVGTVALPQANSLPVHLAVTKTVIGQMLSRQAAQTIFERLNGVMRQRRKCHAWDLSDDDLRKIGLSWRKIRTVREFGNAYKLSGNKLEHWKSLSFDDLSPEVCKVWGMSIWSASILAIFYFGRADVFPRADGTIKRAIVQIEGQTSYSVDPALAAPYRTYLALYLWSFVDLNLFKVSD